MLSEEPFIEQSFENTLKAVGQEKSKKSGLVNLIHITGALLIIAEAGTILAALVESDGFSPVLYYAVFGLLFAILILFVVSIVVYPRTKTTTPIGISAAYALSVIPYGMIYLMVGLRDFRW